MATPGEISRLIAKGKISNAITELENIIPSNNSSLKNLLLTIEARFEKLEKNKIKGILSNQDYTIEQNRITDDLLTLLEKIKSKESKKKRRPGPRFSFTLIITVFILMAIGSLVWYNNFYKPKKILTSEEISSLANEYGLMEIKGVNAHLSFSSGDLAFWVDQKLPKDEIIIHFEARKEVLKMANSNNRKIATQGDLADESEIYVIKKLAEQYGLLTKQNFNSNLVYDEGDCSFWKDKRLTFKEIERRFKLLQEIIEDAEKNKIRISSKDDLGYLLEQKLKNE